MKKTYNTYKKSGVNMAVADKLVSYISKISRKTYKKNIDTRSFKNIGSFGSIFDLSSLKMSHPLIVSSTDGVGTKIEIANILKKYDTIGIDLVAMCVNDLIVQGAKPMIFLDYISINKIDLKKLKSLLKGVVKGCKISDCELVGGETAEMPSTYSKGKFDIAGFSAGIVEKKKILYKHKIKKNNLILAVPSSGLHSNGFSLVRHILKKKKINILKNKFLKKEILKPTKIYVKEVLNLIKNNLLNGCANITGGGLEDNIKRVIPKGLCAYINLNNIKTRSIFNWIKNQGVDDYEMIKTFNCGVGFCLIINYKNLNKVKKFFSKEYQPYIIGKIIPGEKKIKIDGKIHWQK